ncbi:hypothetical protein [Bradyrhizobium sp. S3.9.2]|uniref:hypothetical protein n=1 Tax=unclassified Bradyrhizobium TaxID=2631580 RepID=UPI00339542B7
MKSHYIFFALMALASMATLGKSAILAGVLTPGDFAQYSAAFAFVSLAASAISFGLAEGMVKKFTRLVAFGRSDELRRTLGWDVRKLAWRHLAALGALTLIALAVYGPRMTIVASAVAVLAFATNAFAISASLFRAYDKLFAMSAATMLRAVCALVFCATFASLFNWEVGLWAEAASSALIGVAVLLYFRTIVRSRAKAPNLVASDKDSFVSREADGVWLFAATSTALIPISFDRSWVLHSASGIDSAKYAFLSIWLSAAYTVTSIFVQKWGPDFIRTRLAQRGGILKAALSRSAEVAVFMAVGAAASFVLLNQVYPDIYWAKYRLSWSDAALTVMALTLQISPVFDWALIALDSERAVFAGAVAFVLVWAALFLIVSLFQLGFPAYMLSMGCARAAQMIVAIVMIARRDRAATPRPAD